MSKIQKIHIAFVGIVDSLITIFTLGNSETNYRNHLTAKLELRNLRALARKQKNV